ncbi:adenine phosphoribosyltransferase [Janibacter alkaliphilus]|uniref:Adenine phosphoribosyltransferase n=1 Tax=Janibacter alkaliphilus TaxID=1069963 RepID=A0A852X6H6_9MICO|nr:adenine phosphoribosyltransferase [Janibacter alkaliphilus]
MSEPDEELAARITASLRDIPDFPEPGVLFKDITPLIGDGALLTQTVTGLARPWHGRVDAVAGLEARGFVFGAAVAVALGVGFVPVRKAGKLPADAVGVDYALEYGTARIEAHADAVPAGARVLVVDDVLATGGTAAAACRLFEQLQAEVVGVDVVIELAALGGRERLPERAVRALLTV